MAVWRGRARDKMATSEKLAEENHGDRSRPRARARPLGPTEFPAFERHAWAIDTEIANGRRFTREIRVLFRLPQRQRRRRRRFPISPKHSPSRETARDTPCHPHISRDPSQDAYRINRARLIIPRSSLTSNREDIKDSNITAMEWEK